MPPHLSPGNLAGRIQMLEALGLPPIRPEPELLALAMQEIQCRTLAGLIAKLINENEPLLKAESLDATVTVSEIGSSGTFSFTIHRGGGAR
jgi:hypothetical protein